MALQERNYVFDLLKGLLIFLVVLGHAIGIIYSSKNLDVWYNPVFNVIYTFHAVVYFYQRSVF